MPRDRSGDSAERLSRNLGLFDVYAISTGAMFSSGFFLLPGLAAAETGPSVILAYFLAGLFIIPAMLSVAELSTAMPRAGGAYYFLDRALGPMVGTVGGLGAWFALALKSAFALVGMGAYLALVADVPIKPVALVLTAVFALVNVVGAKETSGLQRVLVTALVGILTLFVLQGVVTIASEPSGLGDRFSPFVAFGVQGLMATVGLVFVSYAGLTKVSSVAEEIRRPERNVPLGMALSLVTATIIYVVGVAILVAVVEPGRLRSDLTPVATAARELFGWLPGSAGLAVIVVAAIAAFASTGNAGILSASRYPLAMARDRLVPDGLAGLGRFRTPTRSILLTAGTIAAAILLLDIEGLAKLASAFILLLFALLNLAVVVMRESGIEAYDPGFASPLYPWMQVAGMLLPFWLIAEMGQLALLFTLGLVAACLAWYFVYARVRVVRTGAIFHTFERLGRYRFDGLDRELAEIVREQGLRDEDAYDVVVARAAVLDLRVPASLDEVLDSASRTLASSVGLSPGRVRWELGASSDPDLLSLGPGVALCHARLVELEHPELVLVRSAGGVALPGEGAVANGNAAGAVFVLVSPRAHPGRHLRLLGHLASHLEDEDFLEHWLAAPDHEALKDLLLREENTLSVRVAGSSPAADLVDTAVADAGLPGGTVVALVRRERATFAPDGGTVLRDGDRLTLIGDSVGIRTLERRFGVGDREGDPVPAAVGEGVPAAPE